MLRLVLLVGVVMFGAIAIGCDEKEIAGFEEISEVPADCRGSDNFPMFADDIAIANEILSEQTDDLTFEREERDKLAAEVHDVLGRVRESLPAAQTINAPRSPRWQISLDFTPEATMRILDPRQLRFPQLEGTLVKTLGAGVVDALSERLGVKAMRVRTYDNLSMTVELCLDDTVNAPAAAREYGALEDVASARPPGLGGDLPALDMRKRDGFWYVVVREASGDCPAGCINETLHYLRVSDSSVGTIDPAEVEHDPLFNSLLGRVRGLRPTPR
jgi:hypothetical protein